MRCNHLPFGTVRVHARRAWLTATVLIVAHTAQADVVPTDGMVIKEDTTFVAGTYSLANGVSIGASGITLDMNGATLNGTDGKNYGVTCTSHDDVIIKNGAAHNYFYGIRIESGARVQVLNCDLSSNWVDPASKGDNPPWLNINVGPNLSDRTNLGGGLFMKTVDGATVSGNTLNDQENGIDLFYVTNSTISDNTASRNTGWGIHLYSSTANTIQRNACDYCTRANLGDSAGVLLVYKSNDNQVLDNSFKYGGDGFFIGNENGCPSNDNFVQGNDGSFAGANAFEATFSTGNQFIDNIASESNYGFWLGYSHDGILIRGNVIRANNANGIEIEHGQNNTIEGNEITFNGGRGIVLRTDGQVHLPKDQYPCLDLPAQEYSRGYDIRDNVIHSNFGPALEFTQTTDSTIVNNLLDGHIGGTATSDGARNTWSIDPIQGQNIVGGATLGGNWWSNYDGVDNDDDGLGDTKLPYTNGGKIASPGDPHPLIGSPHFDDIKNPRALFGHIWIDLGRNTRKNGTKFDTANGTHFATDGTELYLLEGANSKRLSRFDFATNRYEPRADAPDTVYDGGDLQWGGGKYYATVGIGFNRNDGSDKGSYMYAYDPSGNTWASAARTRISNKYYAHEALAYDGVNKRIYATILDYQTGGDANSIHKLAIYNPANNTWTGFTAASSATWSAGSETEYLDGKVYVWRGGSAGGGVTGGDSYLDVYDIATNAWSVTPTLRDSGVIPGFRSGAQDVWGVALAADATRKKVFVMGGESNRQLYVFDIASQMWAVAPTAVYDGGWGDGLEYVAEIERVVQIDGRTSFGNAQGTATLMWGGGDANCDGAVDFLDIDAFVLALADPAQYALDYPECDVRAADCNFDGALDFNDIDGFVALLTR